MEDGDKKKRNLDFSTNGIGGGGGDGSTIPDTQSSSNSWNDTYRNAIENYGSKQKDYLDSLYGELKNSSYKTLLNNRISSAIAKEQALKNTNVALKANGYGSQGVANSNYAKMNNAYINALSNANASYNDQISQYNQQYASSMSNLEQSKDEKLMDYYKSQADYETTENDTVWNNEVIGSLSTLTDESKKLEYLASLGYTTKDASGNVVVGGSKYDALSQAKKDQLNSALYNLDESSSGTTETETGLSVNGITVELRDEFEGDWNSPIKSEYDKEGNYQSYWDSDFRNHMKDKYNGETTALNNLLKDTSYNDGTMFKLENKNGETTYAIMKGGKLYYVKDAQTVWNKIGEDYQVYIKDSKLVSTGKKAKVYN